MPTFVVAMAIGGPLVGYEANFTRLEIIMEKRVIDVLLIRAHDDGRKSDFEETQDVISLMKSRIPLSSDGHVSVGWDERLPPQKEILDCCLPAWKWQGKHGVQPTRQFGTNYALLNEDPAKPDGYNWDPDQRLAEFVALSRIVHPSAISFDYCARLILNESDHCDIIPWIGRPTAYTNEPRTFLLSREWKATAELVGKWREQRSILGEAARRISKALWWREKVAQEHYSEVRWPSLITAVESLVKLWEDQLKLGSTRNFVLGMRLLANEIGIAYTKDEAKLAYEIRSSHAHGQPWPVQSIASYRIQNGEPVTVVDAPIVDTEGWFPTAMELYAKTEGVLDGALRKAILDESFRRVFLDDGLLAERLSRAV